MLNNITNFFNLIKTGKVKTQLDGTDLLPIGTKDLRFSGQYQPTMIKYSDLVAGLVGGSDGQVLFNDNDTIAGASGLYWDKINQRVGIGTSSPANKLDIKGTGDVVLIDSNAVASRVTLKLNTTSASYTQIIGNGTEFNLVTVGSTHITFGTNSAERVRIGSTTGNVLINTTTDAGYKLDVNGTARMSGKLTVESGSLYDAIQFKSNTGLMGYLGSDALSVFLSSSTGSTGSYLSLSSTNSTWNAPQNVIFRTANTERMRIASTGNVLIGTTTDAGYKLDVVGTARISNATWDGTALLLQGPSPGKALHVLANSQVLFESPLTMRGSLINFYEPTGLAAATTLGEITSGGAHWNASNVTRILFAASGGTWSGSSKPTKITFSTTNVGNITATEKISIEPSGNLLINTTTDVASSKLTIESTTQGFLPPRMTTTEKNAIATPATGLMVYDNTLNRPCFYNGTSWITL